MTKQILGAVLAARMGGARRLRGAGFVAPTSQLRAVPPDNAAMNHAKTTEKPAEAIRAFAAGAVKLEQLMKAA